MWRPIFPSFCHIMLYFYIIVIFILCYGFTLDSLSCCYLLINVQSFEESCKGFLFCFITFFSVFSYYI